MSIILMDRVSRSYTVGDNTVNAIDGVSLSLEKGDLIVILGPSGAGKSTLLNLIGGLDSPTDGSIGMSCSYGRDRCGYYIGIRGACRCNLQGDTGRLHGIRVQLLPHRGVQR